VGRVSKGGKRGGEGACKGSSRVNRKVPSSDSVFRKYSMDKGIRGKALQVEGELS